MKLDTLFQTLTPVSSSPHLSPCSRQWTMPLEGLLWGQTAQCSPRPGWAAWVAMHSVLAREIRAAWTQPCEIQKRRSLRKTEAGMGSTHGADRAELTTGAGGEREAR